MHGSPRRPERFNASLVRVRPVRLLEKLKSGFSCLSRETESCKGRSLVPHRHDSERSERVYICERWFQELIHCRPIRQ